jgi:hypothetical protein
MTENQNPTSAPTDDSPHVAAQQQGASDWPRPGDEGYVHPDGTPQSVAQLEGNRRAAADRAAAGSAVHGAPLATPGPQSRDVTTAAQERAAAHSGPTVEDAQRGQTAFVRDGLDAAAQNAQENAAVDSASTPADAPVDATPAADKRTATPAAKTSGKLTR